MFSYGTIKTLELRKNSWLLYIGQRWRVFNNKFSFKRPQATGGSARETGVGGIRSFRRFFPSFPLQCAVGADCLAASRIPFYFTGILALHLLNNLHEYF